MSIPIEVLRWAPTAVAVAALIYSLVTAIWALRTPRERLAAQTPPSASWRSRWAMSLLGVLLVFAAAWFLGLSITWPLCPAVMGGGILAMLLFYQQSFGVRGLQGARTHLALTGSGLAAVSIGALAVGLPMVLRMYAGPTTVDVLLGGALGLWIYTGILILGATPADDESEPTDGSQGSDWPVTGGITLRMALLAGTSLAVASAISTFRFLKHAAGPLLPFAMFAASILFGMLVSPMLRPARSGARPVMRWVGIILFVAGTGASAYLLATRAIGDIKAFYSFGIGLLTAFLVMLLAAFRPPYSRIGASLGAQLAVAQVLVVVAAAVLAFRWMTGFGAALCGVGLAASFPVLLPLAHAWAVRRGGQGADHLDPLRDLQAGVALAETVLVSVSFVIAVTMVRLFVEQVGMSKVGIDVTAPYPLIGLVIGAAMPMLLRMAASSRTTGDGQPSPRGIAGRVMHTLGLWFAAVAVPLVISFFWRAEATGAFLAGLAVSQLYIMLTLWLSEVRGASDADTRSAAGAAQVLALGSGIVAVLLSPRLIDLTADLTRAAKIRSLLVVLAVVFVWVFIVVLRRLRTSGVTSAA